MNKIDLCKIDLCTQCGACMQACPKKCINWQEADAGFSVPQIDRKNCVECGACMRTCHRLAPMIEFQEPLQTYACWTKRLSDRELSSSGGAFSVLARKVLQKGGIVFGATMDSDLRVHHISIEKEEEIILLQGSKYVQSEIGYTFKDVREALRDGRICLFTGTPCQVAALRTFLHGKDEGLITCDIVCHGVPSQKAFFNYVEKEGLKGKCNKISFRFTKGWGYQMSRCVLSATGKMTKCRIIMPRQAWYMRAFNKGLMFSEACYTCVYSRSERVSDITIADYWGLGKEKPFNHPTHKGVSLMLINSLKGKEFAKECEDFELVTRPFSEAVKGNHNLMCASHRPVGRDTFYEDAFKLSVAKLKAKYGLDASLREYCRMLKQWLNSFR